MEMTKVIDDKYEISREIKRGGFGIIYEGIDLLFGKPVAIKAVEPALLNEAKYIDMFQAEALSVARLNHHNIVHIYDIKRGEDGQFYIIMEYIDGPDLADLLRRSRKSAETLPPHLKVYIIAEACAGLDYAHNRRDSETNKPLNVVHQDISPSNIMLTRSGEVKIIDFGMANFRRQRTHKKNEVSVQGKISYLAPEQLNGVATIDRRADIFALGLVLYEVVTGERLFNAKSAEENLEILRSGKWNFKRLDELDVPEKLKEIIKKSVSHSVDKRYPSANHMYMDLMHHLILTAPAADFMEELSDYLQKVYPEAGSTRPEASVEPASPVVERIDRVQRNGEEASRRRQPQTGAPAPQATPASPDTPVESPAPAAESKEKPAEPKTEPAKTETKAPLTAAEEKPAEPEVISTETPAEPEAGPAAKSGETSSKAPQSAKSSPAKTPAAETPPPKQEPSSSIGSTSGVETRSPVAEFGDRSKKDRFRSRRGSGKKDEPYIEVLEPQKSSRSDNPSDFYSIIEETQDEEELKTIIDVVRLSARTHKKGLIAAAISIFVLGLVFTAVDTFMQFTTFGTWIYDSVFPPAIKVSSIPSGAQVYLDDRPMQQTTPLRIETISPGVHKLMLTLPGFEPIVKSINVPGKGRLEVTGESNRSFRDPYVFRFKIQLELSSQPTGADVFIDGVKLAQQTPTSVFWEVGEEPMRITMARPGFPELVGMEINALDGTESIADRRFWKFQKLDRSKNHFAIEGIFRKNISINSNPTRAEIFLNEDERPVGITGLTGDLQLTSGQHVITLRKSGYLPRKFTIDVNEETPSTISETLSRTVRIFAKDANSTDDSDLGARLVELRSRNRATALKETTPTEVVLLPYRYTAVLQKPGYEETFVQIAPNVRTVVARMKPEMAKISVFIVDATSNEPVNACQILYKQRADQVQDEQLGVSDPTGTVIGELAPGTYMLTVIKPGYEAETKSVRLRLGQQNRLTFRLVPRQ